MGGLRGERRVELRAEVPSTRLALGHKDQVLGQTGGYLAHIVSIEGVCAPQKKRPWGSKEGGLFA